MTGKQVSALISKIAPGTMILFEIKEVIGHNGTLQRKKKKKKKKKTKPEEAAPSPSPSPSPKPEAEGAAGAAAAASSGDEDVGANSVIYDLAGGGAVDEEGAYALASEITGVVDENIGDGYGSLDEEVDNLAL